MILNTFFNILLLIQLVCAHLMAAGACANGSAQSGAYPNKPIRLIVPFAPGGVTGIIARDVTTWKRVAQLGKIRMTK